MFVFTLVKFGPTLWAMVTFMRLASGQLTKTRWTQAELFQFPANFVYNWYLVKTVYVKMDLMKSEDPTPYQPLEISSRVFK